MGSHNNTLRLQYFTIGVVLKKMVRHHNKVKGLANEKDAYLLQNLDMCTKDV